MSTDRMFVAAAVILGVFAILYGVMVYAALALATEPEWSRLLVLYSGVEAIGLAAAGALLGTRIQKERVVGAEKRADAAQVKADEAVAGRANAEARGYALRAAIETVEAGSGARGGLEGMATGGEAASLTMLAAQARQLFPDRDEAPAPDRSRP